MERLVHCLVSSCDRFEYGSFSNTADSPALMLIFIFCGNGPTPTKPKMFGFYFRPDRGQIRFDSDEKPIKCLRTPVSCLYNEPTFGGIKRLVTIFDKLR